MITLFRWARPGPYVVAFPSRQGGVSQRPFDTLNLGRLTGDDPARVEQNRHRLCEAVGAAPAELSFNRQVHGARVREADPRANGEPGDALWTDVRGRALLAFTADCLPVALARANAAPAIALVHVGWRGLLGGVVESAAAALGGRFDAVIGPGIGRCCYEVGEEVAAPVQERFGSDLVRDRHLDLAGAAERALRAAGAATVERIDLCTACRRDLFFSHRRDGPRTGRQGGVAFIA